MNAKNDFSFLLVHVWGASQRGGGADLSAAGGQEDMEEKWKRRKPAYWLWGVEGEPGHWATSRFLSHKKNISLLPHHLQVEVNRCSRVQCVAEQAASSIYMDSRSVTLRGTLTLGRYVVLPTTFLPGVTGCFLLRLFSHSRIRLRWNAGQERRVRNSFERSDICRYWKGTEDQSCPKVSKPKKFFFIAVLFLYFPQFMFPVFWILHLIFHLSTYLLIFLYFILLCKAM